MSAMVIIVGISNIEKQRDTIEEKKSSFDPYVIFNQDFLEKIKISSDPFGPEQSASQGRSMSQADRQQFEEEIEQVYFNKASLSEYI